MADGVDLVFHGGKIVSDRDIIDASLAVRDGRIAAIGPANLMPEANEVVDADGLHLLPGVIDPHVHFREPGMTHKEDWATGSQAAACGGVTTVFEMPNTSPPTDSVDALRAKAELAASKSIIDFGLYGLLGEHNLDQLKPMADAGAIGTKLFLGNTTGSLACPSDGAVLEGLEILAETGLRCSVHAESAPIVAWREAKLQAAGRNDPLAHVAARTDVVVLEALNRICLFGEWTGARLHIVHESCDRSLDFIRLWKNRGVDVTAETLPQYLLLAAEDMTRPGGEVMRMNPPIRERAQQKGLWAGLVDGTIDIIATDHAPHTLEEKAGNRIWDVACGFPGVENCLALMLSQVKEGRLSLTDLVRLNAVAPAKAFGLSARKGTLTVGADADIVVIDLAEEETIAGSRLHSKGKVTPFEGMQTKGAPVMTFVRGRLVAKNGEPTADPGWGDWVKPAMAPGVPRNTNTTMKAVVERNNTPF
ncbi:MAG: allantoinase AllB [Pseudomonadota bacterium]